MSAVAKYGVYYPIQWFRREPVRQALRELQETQWYQTDQLKRWQAEQLLPRIRFAASHIPYYRRLYEQAGVKIPSLTKLEDLPRLPLLTKHSVREHAGSLVVPNYLGLVSHKTTGGSTGEAVGLKKDRTATAYARGVMWRNYQWWGVDIGDRQGRFWGVPVTFSQRVRYRLIDFFSNRIRLSSFSFNEEELFAYYGRLIQLRPRYVYGYASMIYEFAVFLQRNNLRFSVPLVITTSEVLYSHQRKLIQEVMRTRVCNEYGCGEVGTIAFECPEGNLHLMSDNLYIEILKEDGQPASFGEVGQVVITELHSRAMPLIRYQLMDYVEMGEERCICGRGLPLIRSVKGRAYDYLVARSGKRFHGEKVMYLLERLQDLGMGVQQIQVVQTTHSNLKVKLVRDRDFRSEALEFMRAYFGETLGQDIEIQFQTVKEIPREKSGKLRVVVCNVYFSGSSPPVKAGV